MRSGKPNNVLLWTGHKGGTHKEKQTVGEKQRGLDAILIRHYLVCIAGLYGRN